MLQSAAVSVAVIALHFSLTTLFGKDAELRETTETIIVRINGIMLGIA